MLRFATCHADGMHEGDNTSPVEPFTLHLHPFEVKVSAIHLD
jgi:hypothetical protein